jgi:hypothetical protein
MKLFKIFNIIKLLRKPYRGYQKHYTDILSSIIII